MKVGFYTLGCKLNFSESSTLGRMVSKNGWAVLPFEEACDVYVVNTCSVTDNADRKCRKIVKQSLHRNPNAKVVVVGCYAQLKPQEIAGIPGVDLVLGAAEKFRLVEHLEQLETKLASGKVVTGKIDRVIDYVGGHSIGDRTRSFLKVQDGCDYQCTFCTIPLARGKSRSDRIEKVVEEARRLGKSGVKEVVLTGVNTGDFGKGAQSTVRGKNENFFELIQALDEVQEIPRFRISSIEPNLLHDEIIDFVASSKRFMPHFHIPLQSGSDYLLKKMRRRYVSELYRDRVVRIRDLMPHACIGADVIVGFPGETDEQFDITRRFLLDIPVNYLHVFTYSERPNTPAIDMECRVDTELRHRRSQNLRMLSDIKLRAFYTGQLGRSLQVLFEEHRDEDGNMAGYSENYVRVKIPFDKSLTNSIREVKPESLTSAGYVRAY